MGVDEPPGEGLSRPVDAGPAVDDHRGGVVDRPLEEWDDLVGERRLGHQGVVGHRDVADVRLAEGSPVVVEEAVVLGYLRVGQETADPLDALGPHELDLPVDGPGGGVPAGTAGPVDVLLLRRGRGEATRWHR